jgi:CheY-like chemotaxis protein/nitrogen-specific signal transduction histidine kinase
MKTLSRYKLIFKENASQLLLICAAFFIMMAVSGLGIFMVMSENLSSAIRYYLNDAENDIKWYLEEPTVTFKAVHSGLVAMLNEKSGRGREYSKEDDNRAGSSRAANAAGASASPVPAGPVAAAGKPAAAGLEDDYLADSDVARYLAQMNVDLTGRSTGNGIIRVYADINGRLFNIDPDELGRDKVVRQSVWYQHGIKNTTPKYTPPYRDDLTGRVVMTLCQQLVSAEGDYRGVLAFDVELESLSGYVKFAEGSYSVIVNEHNHVLAHPDEKMVFSYFDGLGEGHADVPALFDAGQRLVQSSLTNIYGVESVVFILRMYNGWIVCLVIPNHMYYKGFYATLAILLSCGLCLMCLLCCLIARLSGAKMRLENESRNKTSFLARISHEIRTPMNSIIGLSELLLRFGAELPPRALTYCRNIKAAGNNLLLIINDILDFSKIESGDIQVANEKYTLGSLVEDVVSLIKTRMTDPAVVFVVDLDPTLPNELTGDVLKIRQCLLNFLSNSIKYTKLGSIRLEVGGRREGAKLVLLLAVRDTGIGIKRHDLDKLFQNFVRLDPVANLHVEGAGLGLVITKNLCETMGGQISVASTYGHGSTFRIFLPQTVAGESPLAAVADPGRHRVLVYEDKLPLSRSMAQSLAALSVSAEIVSTWERFRSKLKSDEWTHVVLPRDEHPNYRETLRQNHPRARIGLTVREPAAPPPSGGASFLAAPVHCLTLANFLNYDPLAAGSKNSPVVPFTMPEARVLVVDDLETNLVVAEGLLEVYGIQVDLARGGQESVMMARDNDYDLIFMDHMMPGMDGLEAARQIRSLDGYDFKSPPIVALTANAVHGMREMFLGRGFDDFLAKPVDCSKLERLLLAHIPGEKIVRDPNPRAPGAPGSMTPGDDDGGSRAPSGGNGRDADGGPDGAGVPRGSERAPRACPEAAPGRGAAGAGETGADDGAGPGRTSDNSKPTPARLDFEAGRAHCGGREETYRKLLRIFLTDAAKAREILATTLGEKNLRDYTIHVHAMKSASATVGAAGLSELAAGLEAAGREERTGPLETGTPRFLEELEAVSELARAYLEKAGPGPKKKTGVKTSGDGPEIKDRLRALSKAFDEADTATINATLERLRKQKLDPTAEEALEKVSACYLDAEYEKAAGIIEELLAG